MAATTTLTQDELTDVIERLEQAQAVMESLNERQRVELTVAAAARLVKSVTATLLEAENA